MTQYHAPLADIRFALNDVLGAASLFQRLPNFESATPDIVDAVLFLESAPFVTGEILHVDGGQSAGH